MKKNIDIHLVYGSKKMQHGLMLLNIIVLYNVVQPVIC